MLTTVLIDIIYILIIAGISTFIKYGIPYINEKFNNIKEDFLKDFIENAICYAENKFGASTGTEKFDYVYQAAKNWIDKKKIDITEDQLKIYIEGIFTYLNDIEYVNRNKQEEE